MTCYILDARKGKASHQCVFARGCCKVARIEGVREGNEGKEWGGGEREGGREEGKESARIYSPDKGPLRIEALPTALEGAGVSLWRFAARESWLSVIEVEIEAEKSGERRIGMNILVRLVCPSVSASYLDNIELSCRSRLSTTRRRQKQKLYTFFRIGR